MTIQIGCADLPRGINRERAARELSYLETSLWLTGPVKQATWRQWSASVPAGFLGLTAPVVITHPSGRGAPPHRFQVPDAPGAWGELRDTPTVRTHVAQLAAAAVESKASAVVFHTPPSFSPSQSHRDMLRHFFTEVATAAAFGDAARVWRPDGLWEPPAAVKLAAELGVVCALDPLVEDPTGTPPEFYESMPVEAVYFRVSGLGRPPRKLPPFDLDRLAELVELYGRAWVVFATAERFRDARAFRDRVAETLGTAGAEEPADEAEEGDDHSAEDEDE